ncbi:MAG: hypothetical protein KAT05_06895 [Spirochaetes bacterium]|nr:hypothetical protein [Spirochaetota bacterium]
MLRSIIDKIKNRQTDGVLKHTSTFIIFIGFITLLNMLFRKYISGQLSKEAYGAFTSLLSFYAIIASPIAVIPMYISKNMSLFLKNGQNNEAFTFHKLIIKKMFFIILIFIAVLICLAPIIKVKYHLHSVFPIFLAISILFFSFISVSYTSALQSMQRFATLGSINVASSAIKLGLTVLFFSLIIPATGITTKISTYNFAIFSMLVGVILSSFIVYITFNKNKINQNVVPVKMNIKLRELGKSLIPIALLIFSFELVKNIDEYFARHFLTRHDNGLYGAITTIGKSAIILSATIIYVIFPKLSAKVEDIVATKRIMLKGIILAAGSFSAILFAITFFPELIIQVLTNKKYLIVAPYLKWFFIAFMPFALVQIFVNFFIIHTNIKFIIGLIFLVIPGIVAFQLIPHSIINIIIVLGITGYTLLTYSAFFWYKNIKSYTPVVGK